jgi:hypothetical protein
VSARNPRSFNEPEADYLSPDHIDNVARALLNLAREVAVLTDRTLVLEELLEKQGVVAREAIETYQPDEAFQTRSDAAMARILENVISALQGRDGAS